MKYMTYNRSCSYACLANLLEFYGIDKTDRDIALEMNLPYLFSYNDELDKYMAGPMLQGKEWFDLYLNQIGFSFVEDIISKNEIINYLKHNVNDCIIGLKLNNVKHAVIYKGYINNLFKFMNVKHEHSNEPDYYTFTEGELLLRLDEIVHVGYIKKTDCKGIINQSMYEQSLIHFGNYEKELIALCLIAQNTVDLALTRDKYFAPLLLDICSMMEIINETNLRERIVSIREKYMEALKLNKEKSIKLADYLDINLLREVLSDYKELIKSKLNTTNNYTYSNGYREGVVFALLNPNNEILVEYRDNNGKDNVFFPNGSIETKDYQGTADYLITALYREVQEELNIDFSLQNVDYLGELEVDEIKIVFYIYLITKWDGKIPEFIVEAGEKDAKLKWISLASSNKEFEFESAHEISRRIKLFINKEKS